MVLANGSVVNANQSANADLFWALKGGGPNFGVVTRFDVATIPVSTIWYEVLTYSTDQAAEALDALARWQLGGAADTRASVVFLVSLEFVELALIYAEPQATRPASFSPFYDLEPLAVLVAPANGTFAELGAIAGSGSAPPMRYVISRALFVQAHV